MTLVSKHTFIRLFNWTIFVGAHALNSTLSNMYKQKKKNWKGAKILFSQTPPTPAPIPLEWASVWLTEQNIG